MKILYVVHGFPPHHIGGVETYAYNLAAEISKYADVYVFSRHTDVKLKELSLHENNMGKIHLTNIINNFSKKNDFIRLYKNKDIESVFEKYLREIRPDIVHFHHCIGLSASLIEVTKKLKIPSVLTIHDYWYICPNINLLDIKEKICSGPGSGIKCIGCFKSIPFIDVYSIVRRHEAMVNKIFKIICKINLVTRRECKNFQAITKRFHYMEKILNIPDRIIFPSMFIKRVYEDFFGKDNRFLLSPHGIKTNGLNKINKPSHEGVNFVYIGSLLKLKGVHILIEAFNKINYNNVSLKIYGDSFDKKYKKYIRKLASNPNIEFLGKFSNSQLPKILAETDVLILPSICYESFSIVIREAFAAGIPVITSDIGAQKEAINNRKNGILFKNGDAEDLKRQIIYITEHPEFLERAKKYMPKIKKIEEQAIEMLNLYNEIVGYKK